MAADRDSAGVIRLRYDGELRGTTPEEGDTNTKHTRTTHTA